MSKKHSASRPEIRAGRFYYQKQQRRLEVGTAVSFNKAYSTRSTRWAVSVFSQFLHCVNGGFDIFIADQLNRTLVNK